MDLEDCQNTIQGQFRLGKREIGGLSWVHPMEPNHPPPSKDPSNYGNIMLTFGALVFLSTFLVLVVWKSVWVVGLLVSFRDGLTDLKYKSDPTPRLELGFLYLFSTHITL